MYFNETTVSCIGEYCRENEQCKGANVECQYNRCVCRKGYKLSPWTGNCEPGRTFYICRLNDVEYNGQTNIKIFLFYKFVFILLYMYLYS